MEKNRDSIFIYNYYHVLNTQTNSSCFHSYKIKIRFIYLLQFCKYINICKSIIYLTLTPLITDIKLEDFE